MEDQQIRFDDGASYERMMGVWSRLAGDVFLDWLKPGAGLRWVDVGCGNGAFTERVVKRFAPAEIHGVDPSEAQLNFARARPGVRTALFHLGDAMALPFSSDRFDVAVMALVIFFVPDPAKGVAEMVRVVRPGGEVAAYVWDIVGGKGAAAPVELRDAGDGPYAAASAEFRSLADKALQEIVGRGSRCRRDARDRGTTHVQRL